jgi:hypothetical protein
MAIVALMGFAGNIISIAVLSRYIKILFFLISKDFCIFKSNACIVVVVLINCYVAINVSKNQLENCAGIFKQSMGPRNPEPVFVNVYEAQESIPRNLFR